MPKFICRALCLVVFFLLANSFADAQDRTFDAVIERATKKSNEPFVRPARVANKDFDYGNPPKARGLVYAEALKIVPKNPIVENEGTGYSAYPRRGTSWEKMRIFVQGKKGDPDSYREYKYKRNLVDYTSPEIQPPLPKAIPRSVQHWTEVGVFSPMDGGFPQLLNMRANGYMRLASKGTVYGHSERGFIEQESLDERPGTEIVREKFPILTEVFLAQPTHGSATAYQIYENESAVLARKIELSLGNETIMKVTGRIIPRTEFLFTAKQNIGICHISMYWKGTREDANDGEHAHDSDTVEVTYDDGSSKAFDIPRGYSKDDPRRFVFVDLQDSKTISSYTLEQRDRNAQHYVPNVDYHKRASMRISDMSWSVPTETQLVVLPDDGEFFDNVVLRTVIRPTDPTNEVIQFSYTETIPQLAPTANSDQ